jgi:asparagine synthase (glutamine-hydrolysing)
MCGLAGVHRGAQNQVDSSLLLAMAGELRHRGPDGTGLYLDGPFGMVNTRLAIVDLAGGDQPLSEERGRYWVMQNGEVYNYVELMDELRQLGHRFETTCDTEVIAHAYEEWGPRFLERLNGDFAIAVWDRERQEVLLARDRFGVRPLFLAELGGDVCFASEAKALLRHPAARRELDPVGILDTFTTWSTLPDRSAFVGIRELPPAHYAIVGRDGIVEERRWWDLEFSPVEAREDDLVDELEAILESSTQIRLRADVPVAAYLSGGLDSSVTAALAARTAGPGLHAFGVGFSDQRFDESAAQDAIAAELGVQFHRTTVGAADIAAVFPRVVELAEKPLLRTAPAPLLELAGAVQDAHLKVVLTGEGADELLGGYDIFREDKVRRFWARSPESKLRPLLFTRLNRWLSTDPARAGAFLGQFYGRDLTNTGDPLYSHRIRFANTARCLRLLRPDFLGRAAGDADPAERLIRSLPPGFGGFSELSRAQYLEVSTFFQGYLLHAQGDRMLMGHSIEGRFPFVDVRLAELAARLPDNLRLRGLREKYALRKVAARLLPQQIHERPKIPYRAPISGVFFGAGQPAYVSELLRPEALEAAGVLDPGAVSRLVAKFESGAGRGVSETDEMALVGALSIMLLHEQLVASPVLAEPLKPGKTVVGDAVQAEPVAEAV